MRLFCLPYAGGGASTYRPWAASLPPDVQLCAVQLPGRESRLGGRPSTRVTDLVPRLVDGLRRARAVGGLSRLARTGGGTTIPGKLLWKLDPDAIDRLAGRLAQG